MYGAHLASLLHHSCSSTTCRWMILGASLTRCSLPACACFTDGCVPLGGGFSRCSRWSSPGWRMHLPWRSGRLEGTDLAYLTRRPSVADTEACVMCPSWTMCVPRVVCSSLAPGSRITWLGSIDLQCTVLVLSLFHERFLDSHLSYKMSAFSSGGLLRVRAGATGIRARCIHFAHASMYRDAFAAWVASNITEACGL